MSLVSYVNSAKIVQIFATVPWESICRLRPPFSRKPFCQSSANSWKKFTLTWSTPITKQNYAEGRTYTELDSCPGLQNRLKHIHKRIETWSKYTRMMEITSSNIYLSRYSLEDDVTVNFLLFSFIAWNINCAYYTACTYNGRDTDRHRGVQTDIDREAERRREK